MSQCKVVFWDVGGTLLDYRCSLAESVRERLGRAGIDHVRISDESIAATFEDYFRDEPSWLTAGDERAASEKWAARLLPPELASSVANAADHLLWYETFYEPVDGIDDLLSDLKRRGLRQVVVSNWPPSLPRILAHHRLTEHFDAVVFSAEDGIHKPDERIYRRALASAGAAPHEAIFIGDVLEWDVEPPRRLGMRAIHFDPRRRQRTCDAYTVAKLRERLLSMLDV